MKTKIQKWGNSLGVRLPKSVREATAITPDTEVLLSVKDHKIVIEPIGISTRQKLENKLAKVSPENIHTETDWGVSQGREVW